MGVVEIYAGQCSLKQWHLTHDKEGHRLKPAQMRDNLKDLEGRFTWDFGSNFIIETEVGAFIWSDPAYHGTGVIRPLGMTLQEYFKTPSFGRDKGTHRIGKYCGDFTFHPIPFNILTVESQKE